MISAIVLGNEGNRQLDRVFEFVAESGILVWIVISVVFTENIQRHIACPPALVSGATVCEVLDHVFEGNERARGYVLDDLGAVRKHMVVFVNGKPIRDRATLSDPVIDGSEVYVMQALSGG